MSYLCVADNADRTRDNDRTVQLGHASRTRPEPRGTGPGDWPPSRVARRTMVRTINGFDAFPGRVSNASIASRRCEL